MVFAGLGLLRAVQFSALKQSERGWKRPPLLDSSDWSICIAIVANILYWSALTSGG